MFLGVEDVPFRFAACSHECRDKVDRMYEDIQSKTTYRQKAHAATTLEPYHIWALRRLSKLGCYVNNALRVDPSQLAVNSDMDLVDDDIILAKILRWK